MLIFFLMGTLRGLPSFAPLIVKREEFYLGRHSERYIRHPHHLQPQNSHLLLIILVRVNPDQIFHF